VATWFFGEVLKENTLDQKMPGWRRRKNVDGAPIQYLGRAWIARSLAILLTAGVSGSQSLAVEPAEVHYLAFQIFSYGRNPQNATMGDGAHPQIAQFPDKATLCNCIDDIKQRIGTVGDGQTRLAVMLEQLSFDHGNAEVRRP
jgi:hypothetical protein